MIPPFYLKELGSQNSFYIIDNTPFPKNGANSGKALAINIKSEVVYYIDEKYYHFIIICKYWNNMSVGIIAVVLLLFLILLIIRYVR